MRARSQRAHVLAHRRVVRVVEHVQRGLDAGAGLDEIEPADGRTRLPGSPAVELGAHLDQWTEEGVLDQPAHVVVDVDAHRVRPVVGSGELDQDGVDCLTGRKRRTALAEADGHEPL
ncbi:MAG: hypothetical protein M3417_09245 [Actinomycetota bacterium]|nr:hypothetical protein [Actinomycetota bacterium]